MVIVLVMPFSVVSADMKNIDEFQLVLKGTQEFSYEENILDKIPEEIIELTSIDKDLVSELDIVDDENMYSFTTINEDGTKTLYSFDKAIKYLDDETNTIRFIDIAIEEINQRNTSGDILSYRSIGSAVDILFAKEATDGIELNNGKFTLKLIPKMDGINEAEKNTVCNQTAESGYGNITEYIEYSGIDDDGASLQYFVTNDGIKENIILEKYSGNNIIQFEIYTNGLIPSNNEGTEIYFIDEETENIEYIINPSFIEEAYNIEKENKDITYDNYYTIEELEDNKFLLSMVLDKNFLENSETEYPVLIDPTISVNGSSAFQDTYAKSTSDENHSSETSFYVANLSTIQSMAYIKFDVSRYKYINPNLVNSVTFNAVESINGVDVNVSLYDCNNLYNINSVTYSQLSSDTGAYQSSCTSTTGYSFDITNLFKKWLRSALNESGGKQWQYGFKLKTTVADTLKFISTENIANVPYMSINYSEDTSINDGVYYIKNKLSGKYLEVPDSAKSSGTQCQQNEYKGSKNQQWKVVDIGDGTYILRPMHAENYALDVYSGSVHGSAVDIYLSSTNSPINDTKWKIVENENGSYRLMSIASEKQYCLVVQGASFAAGANCIQYIYNASQNDQWIFEPAIDAAEYYITSVSNGRNLSLSSTNNAIVSIADTTQDIQRWSIVRQTDGTYKLYNKTGDWKNGKDYLGCEESGTAVKMNSGAAMNWSIIINDDGTLSFQNVYNEKYLTTASTGYGVTVQSYIGTNRQKWNITTAVKDIYIGGFWEPPEGQPDAVASVNNSGIFASDEVKEAFRNMNNKEPIVYNSGTSENIINMIRASSIFSIYTHGASYLIQCNSNIKDEFPEWSYLSTAPYSKPYTLITELPNDCFATTRLAFLGACSNAEQEEGVKNIATVLHEKGIQTIIAFDSPVLRAQQMVFQREFFVSLGEGKTLEQAISDADDKMQEYIIEENLPEYDIVSRLVIIGNDDMSATFVD